MLKFTRFVQNRLVRTPHGARFIVATVGIVFRACGIIDFIMKGLILAGGKGTRLRPLTLNTPKPIVPVANRPFLLYQIDLMKSVGISEIILSLSYQSQKIEDLIKDGADLNIVIRYAIESSPLGTGGAFRNAEEWIDSTTVVFNGDVLTSLDLESVIDFLSLIHI